MTQTRNSGDSGHTWTDWREQPDAPTAHQLAALETCAPGHVWQVRMRCPWKWSWTVEEYRRGQWIRAWHEEGHEEGLRV